MKKEIVLSVFEKVKTDLDLSLKDSEIPYNSVLNLKKAINFIISNLQSKVLESEVNQYEYVIHYCILVYFYGLETAMHIFKVDAFKHRLNCAEFVVNLFNDADFILQISRKGEGE